MSNLQNLASRIASVSSELAVARSEGDVELIEDLEDELFLLEEEMEEEEEFLAMDRVAGRNF